MLIVLAVAALVIAVAVASGSGDENKDKSSTTSATTPATAPAATTGETTPQTTPAETTPAPAKPAAPVVRVVGGKPQGGVQRIEFAKGDQVRFTVRSDVADEIHVHGYDLAKDVPAGGSVSFSFPAKIDGRFEIELEHRGEQIAELEVTP
jgi:hypothetical protein